MNYIIVSAMCIIALIIGVLNLIENELIDVERKKLFLILAPIIVLEIIIDTIGFCIDGNNAVKNETYRAIKIIEFIIVPAIPAILSKFITRRSFWKKIRKYFYIMFTINAITQILNFISPLIFNINEQTVYIRTNFWYLYLLNLTICAILFVISANNTFVQNPKANYTLIALVLFEIVGVTTRLLISKCNSDWLCITFSYFVIILIYDNCYLKIDSITTLLNRNAFDNKMKSINYRTCIIVIDANDFKNINDTYGHNAGDLALAKIAEAIINVYGKIGYCYRIGGDEFAVILKKGIIKSLIQENEYCDIYLMITNFMKSLDIEIETMFDDDENVKKLLINGVSQGYGIYYLPADTSPGEKHKTITEVFDIADKRMYECKNEKKI